MPRRRLFDAYSIAATPRHAQLYGRYEKVYTVIDFLAAATFVAGSVLFLIDGLHRTGTWAFLVGSVFFAARPTVTVLREFHLSRIALPGDAAGEPGQGGTARAR